MSLVRKSWLILVGAAAIAIVLPVWLLSAPAIVPDPPSPVTVTPMPRLKPAGVAGAAQVAPPFAHDRLPEGVATSAAPASSVSAEAAVAAPAPVEPPQLVGIALGPRSQGIALVRVAGETATTILKLGDAAGGWRLVHLRPGNAEFARDGEKRTLALDYRNKTAPDSARLSGAPSPALPLSAGISPFDLPSPPPTATESAH